MRDPSVRVRNGSVMKMLWFLGVTVLLTMVVVYFYSSSFSLKGSQNTVAPEENRKRESDVSPEITQSYDISKTSKTQSVEDLGESRESRVDNLAKEIKRRPNIEIVRDSGELAKIVEHNDGVMTVDGKIFNNINEYERDRDFFGQYPSIHPLEQLLIDRHKIGGIYSENPRIVTHRNNQGGFANALMSFFSLILFSIFSDFSPVDNMSLNSDPKFFKGKFFKYRNPILDKLMWMNEEKKPSNVSSLCGVFDDRKKLDGECSVYGSISARTNRILKTPDNIVPVEKLWPEMAANLKPPFCLKYFSNNFQGFHVTCNKKVMKRLCHDLQLCDGIEEYLPYHFEVECKKPAPVIGYPFIGTKIQQNMFKVLFDVRDELKDRFDAFVELSKGPLITISARLKYQRYDTPNWGQTFNCFKGLWNSQILPLIGKEGVATVFLTADVIVEQKTINMFQSVSKNLIVLTRANYSSPEFIKKMTGVSFQFDKNYHSKKLEDLEVGVSILFDFMMIGKGDFSIVPFISTWGWAAFGSSSKFPPWVQYTNDKKFRGYGLPKGCVRPRVGVAIPQTLQKNLPMSHWVYNFNQIVNETINSENRYDKEWWN